jgi:hypothetical protein
MYVCVHVCVFVGSCLATKVFIGNLLAMRRGQRGGKITAKEGASVCMYVCMSVK